MSIDANVAIQIGIMLIAGIVSGLASFAWNKDPTRHWRDYALVSTVATFTVPLLLRTISSDLLTKTENFSKDAFVFAGLCLLAGFNAPKHLQRMYDKLFEDVASANRKIDSTERKLATVADTAETAQQIALIGAKEDPRDVTINDGASHG